MRADTMRCRLGQTDHLREGKYRASEVFLGADRVLSTPAPGRAISVRLDKCSLCSDASSRSERGGRPAIREADASERDRVLHQIHTLNARRAANASARQLLRGRACSTHTSTSRLAAMSLKVPKANNIQLFKDGYKVRV